MPFRLAQHSKAPAKPIIHTEAIPELCRTPHGAVLLNGFIQKSENILCNTLQVRMWKNILITGCVFTNEMDAHHLYHQRNHKTNAIKDNVLKDL